MKFLQSHGEDDDPVEEGLNGQTDEQETWVSGAPHAGIEVTN